MIDLARAIDAEAVSVTLTREAEGGYSTDPETYGKWVPGGKTEAQIRAAIQPASGRQLNDLPEGIRNEARWLIWTRSVITLGDTISNGGSEYRVMYVWPRIDGGFWRAALGLLA